MVVVGAHLVVLKVVDSRAIVVVGSRALVVSSNFLLLGVKSQQKHEMVVVCVVIDGQGGAVVLPFGKINGLPYANRSLEE